ncbi:hypothetical protein SCO01_22440 [Staphylococcus cohnii subsp. cohnii]|nr:hypothetical protein SCO01_22440 [Staphylococcus cohnii subsp. cohnii]
MMIEGGKLIDIVFINSLLIKINVSRLEAFIISLIFVSDGLIKIVINVIIKKKIVEYFRLF